MDDYRAIAQQYATQFGIPADLFMRQIQAESAWDPTALSPAGAIGLGQLMPTTAQELGVDIMNPQDNLYGAAKYLRQMYDRFGDWRTALAAYNAGPGRVEQYGGIPPFEETQNYVSSILDEQDVRGGQTMPTMPQEQRPSGLLEMMGVQRQGTGGPQGDLPFYQRDRFKDFAGRLAMAANTLSQRPDPTVPQVVLGAQQSRKANRTAEWLAQQPGGAPYAQMMNAGVDPGVVLAEYRKAMTGPEQTAAMKNYQYLVAQGMSPDDAMAKAFSGGTTINMPGEMSDRDKLLGKYQAETMIGLADTGTAAYSTLGQVDTLDALLGQTTTGFGTGLASWAKDNLGLNVVDDAAVAAGAIINQLVPAQRPPGSGTMSDADLALYKSSLPRLSNTPEGNQIIIDGMRAQSEYNIKVGEIADAYMSDELSYSEAKKQIASLGSPLTAVAERIRAGGYDKGASEPVEAPSDTSNPNVGSGAPVPNAGDIVSGEEGSYRFLGGDPNNEDNWEKI